MAIIILTFIYDDTFCAFIPKQNIMNKRHLIKKL